MSQLCLYTPEEENKLLYTSTSNTSLSKNPYRLIGLSANASPK
jgi:hypothetical protein